MTIVRTLRTYEGWPEGMQTGFELIPPERIDRDWVFLAEHECTVVGVLILAPAHGLIFILRLCMRPEAPKVALRTLLSSAMRICRERGYPMFLTAVDPTQAAEREFIGIARKWRAPAHYADGHAHWAHDAHKERCVMPQLFALLPALLTGVGGAIGIGEGISSLVNKPQMPDLSKLISQPPTVTPPTQGQIQQNALLARGAATDEAVNLGGALAPNFLQEIASNLNPSQPGYGQLGYQGLTGQPVTG